MLTVTTATPHLSLNNIARACKRIDPVFTDTPQFECAALSARLGCQLVVKVETLNPIGSFKARGAYFMLRDLPGSPVIVCATAGNFGQGMAHAARALGLQLTVFAPMHASPLKIERMRALGATVHCVDDKVTTLHARATQFAADSGAVLVQDGRDPAIAEGAGTIGVELLRWPKLLDLVAAPVGDGALLAGVARWIKAHSPRTRLIGVCAARAPAMRLSWCAHRAIESSPQHTIAVPLAIESPFAESVADLVQLADDILEVDDDALTWTMQLAYRELGLVLEPAGAAGLAGIAVHAEQFRGKRVAAILTGGGALTRKELRRWLVV